MIRTYVLALLGLLLLDGSAQGYELRQGKYGKVLIWDRDEVEVEVDSGGISDVAGAADAVRAAFASWTSAGMPLQVMQRSAHGAHESGSDARNVVLWVTNSWRFAPEVVGMTVSMYERDTGFVSDADILLNAIDFRWTTSPNQHPDRYDVQNVLAHEVGHFMGLGHSDDPESTMFASTPAGETKKRNLGADDRQGLAALVAESNRRRGKEQEITEHPEPTAQYVDEPALPERVGCNVGGSARSANGELWFLLLLALAAPRRRGARRLLMPIIALVGSVSMPLPVRATVVQELTISQLARRAAVVLRGRVTMAHARWQDGLIVTEHTVAVEQCVRGQCAVSTVVLQTLGGEIGNRVMHVAGAPRPRLGDQILLFARRRGAVLQTVGLAQGMFRVRGQTALRDLTGLQLIRRSSMQAGDLRLKPLPSAGQQRFALSELINEARYQP